MKKGFTLIELLVVVLIIGILSAVALPQYNKAVWKSRVTQLFVAINAINTAQEAYYMANGNYSKSFSELDITYDNLQKSQSSSIGASVETTDAVRYNDMFELVLGSSSLFSSTGANFLMAPYEGGGLSYFLKETSGSLTLKKIYCKESISQIKEEGVFCRKILGCKKDPIIIYQTRYYEMP